MGEEFEAVEQSGTRTDSSHSSTSSDSTTPLSPDHPLTYISSTPTPSHALFHCRTTRMTMRVPPAMSLGHSARVTDAMALSNSAFSKRYRSSYESPSSSSSPALPVRKRYRGTSELILDTDSEEDKLGDKDIEEDESLDADDEGERSDDEGHGSDDEGRSLGDEDHRLDEEGRGLEGEGLGLAEEEGVAPEGQQHVVPVVDTATSEPLGLRYGEARRRALKSIEEIAPSTYEVGQSSRSMPVQQGADKTPLSPEWSLGSLPVSPSSLIVPSPIASPVATPTATISHLDVLPPTLVIDIDRDVRELYTRSGQAAMQRELQEMRGRVAALEQERGHREP
ncbi:hypothetical protein Tco_0209304 [Tanacetum coccineum]